jgi:hypothetical protein
MQNGDDGFSPFLFFDDKYYAMALHCSSLIQVISFTKETIGLDTHSLLSIFNK